MSKKKKFVKQVDRSVAYGDMDLVETGVAICFTCGHKVKYAKWDGGICPKCFNRMVVEW